jgi:murein DD-endopeptidase MepM/ murein hydrolase activator NlpD
MKGKMIIALLPVALIVFVVLIILAIIAACFGNEEMIIRSSFTLPFNTTDYVITSPFGTREDPISSEIKTHNGVDVVPHGTTDILAVGDGVVVSSDIDSQGAEYVIIEHNFGGTKYRTGYWHLKENSRCVKVGDNVKQGQQIGIMGSTGYSTGPHLHFFLQEYDSSKKSFEYKDPINIIKNKILPESVNLYNYDTNSYQQSNPFENRFDLIDPNNRYELPTLTP